MADRKADLHIHTIASDGTCSIQEIFAQAKEREIKTISITDHDSVGSYVNLKEIPRQIELIPGIELSCEYMGKSIHVLGYYIDTANKELNETLVRLREKRIERIKKIIKKFEEFNIYLNYEDILRDNDLSSVGRVHVARALVQKGVVNKGIEAFELYLADDKPCYIKNDKLSTKEGIELIRNSGGIPVLAHPGLINEFDDYKEILEEGFEGIEVFHPKHTREEREFFHDLALKNSLLITGGSDFHTYLRNNRIGQAYMSQLYIKKLKEYEEKRH